MHLVFQSLHNIALQLHNPQASWRPTREDLISNHIQIHNKINYICSHNQIDNSVLFFITSWYLNQLTEQEFGGPMSPSQSFGIGLPIK
jgi:hypothetical protein